MLNEEIISLCVYVVKEIRADLPAVLNPASVDLDLYDPIYGSDVVRTIHQSVKDIIVGLELQGHKGEASRVEQGFEEFREACRMFDGDHGRSLLGAEGLEEAASRLSGVFEDVMTELPSDA